MAIIWIVPDHTCDEMRGGDIWAGGGAVNYVQNFTDMNNKILNRVSDEGTTNKAISCGYIKHYVEAIHLLIGQPEVKSYAYAAEDDGCWRSSLPTMASFLGDLTQHHLPYLNYQCCPV